MILGRVVALFTLVVPVFAQYAGPAILSRGDAPVGVTAQPLGFVPNFEVNGIFDTGLAGAAVNAQGQLQSTSSFGVQFAGGISGNHSWGHTQLGLSYRGNLNHFVKATFFDGSNQSLSLSVTHQFTRHLVVSIRLGANLLSTGVVSTALEQGIAYDPSQSIVPATNFIDNRTFVVSTAANLVYKQSARLSFSAQASGYLNRRRAANLAGVTGVSATGDVQYRVSLRSTIGADYSYASYTYTRVFSGSDVHSFHGTYSMALSKNVEFSAFGGVSRAESKSERVVVVDPIITALLGITSGLEIVHAVTYSPSASGRLSRTFHNGVVYITAAHAIVPGNGLFLTSNSTIAALGASYTASKNWSFTTSLNFNRSQTLGLAGNYGNVSGRVAASRKFWKTLSFVASFTASEYESSAFSLYNRTMYSSAVGIGWSPGNVPIRLW